MSIKYRGLECAPLLHTIIGQKKIWDELIIPLDKDIVVVIEDNTRPHSWVVSTVLNKIQKLKGMSRQTKIVVARVVHTPPDDKEELSWLGPGNQGFCNYFHCSTFGDSSFISDDRHVIGIGCVTPHTHVGFSGGGKLICPGLLDWNKIKKFHKMSRSDAESMVTWYEGKIDQLVNFTVNHLSEPVEIAVGNPSLVRGEILKNVRKTYGYKFREEDLLADIVILTPTVKRRDMFQVMNVLNIFDQNPHILKPGGTLCIATRFDHGVGSHSIFGQTQYDVDTRYASVLKDKHIQFVTNGDVSIQDLNKFFNKSVYKVDVNWFDWMINRYPSDKKIIHYLDADIMIGV